MPETNLQIQISLRFGGHLPQDLCLTDTQSKEGEPKFVFEFPMLWRGQREMSDTNSELDPISQVRTLRENQRFHLVAYPSICALHSGLETAASLAPPWHCNIFARVNTGKQPEMATNQNHKGPDASLTNLGFARS